MQELTEGIHYYLNEDGFMVFTKQYHLEKGHCCGLGCLHCPYNYENVPEPKKTELLKSRLISDEE
ncbi:MAG TPA: DUF5522 domain-containing protein [Chitinophagaceae bacterium]|nr:DUF5522 domain-containing protein [Chitinophagaceae bacterium]